MKSVEDGLGLSFPSRALRTSRAKLDPRPRSSHVGRPLQCTTTSGGHKTGEG
jgi:hypothetical protein